MWKISSIDANVLWCVHSLLRCAFSWNVFDSNSDLQCVASLACRLGSRLTQRACTVKTRSNCFNLDTFRSQKGVCLVCLTVLVRIRLLSIFLHWFMTLPWERLPKVQSCTGLNAFYCHGLKKQQQLTLYSVYIMWLAMRVVVMQQAPVDDWAKDQSVATARPHPVCLPFSITKVLCQSNAWNHETELWHSMCFRMASSC